MGKPILKKPESQIKKIIKRRKTRIQLTGNGKMGNGSISKMKNHCQAILERTLMSGNGKKESENGLRRQMWTMDSE